MFLIRQKVLKKHLQLSRVNYLHIMLHRQAVSVLLIFSSFTTDSDLTDITTPAAKCISVIILFLIWHWQPFFEKGLCIVFLLLRCHLQYAAVVTKNHKWVKYTITFFSRSSVPEGKYGKQQGFTSWSKTKGQHQQQHLQ